MKSPEECLEMLAAAYHCPDVAMTETIALIQLDAFKAGMARAADIADECDNEYRPETSSDEIQKAINSLKPGDLK